MLWKTIAREVRSERRISQSASGGHGRHHDAIGSHQMRDSGRCSIEDDAVRVWKMGEVRIVTINFRLVLLFGGVGGAVSLARAASTVTMAAKESNKLFKWRETI